VLSPKSSPLGKFLKDYVLVRITRMDHVDVALFDYDRNNTIYFFLMNADEQIYMRYGGRDARSADSYLNLESLAAAARKGLELHEAYKAGRLAKAERPKPLFPREIPLLVKRTFAQGSCVECHLIGDFQNMHREQDGTLDKLVHLFRSPDVRTIGIELDVPSGLVVKTATGASQAAGLQSGDRIATWASAPVWTFADVQYQFDKTPRTAKNLKIGVERAGQMRELTVELSERWWWTDTRWRQSSIEPRSYFEDRALTAEEKRKLGVAEDSFASEVKYVAEIAKSTKAHELQVGDVIVAVDGVEKDGNANTAALYLILKKTPGDTAKLTVLRAGKRIEMPLQTVRMSFRK
jgi:serine protease Do